MAWALPPASLITPTSAGPVSCLTRTSTAPRAARRHRAPSRTARRTSLLRRHSMAICPTTAVAPYSSSSPEPLSWLKPGGSGRDHRPLYAALTTRATASALSGPTRRPFCKRPTLTRGGLGRPTKGGRQTPASRGLVLDSLLIRRLQGGLPPRPGLTRLTRIEQGGCWIHEACQPGREEIALRASPTGAGMPALGARFLLDPAAVAGLGESCPPGIDVHDGPASTHSQARQSFDKHPRRAELDRSAIAPLPGAIRQLLQLEGACQWQHPIGQLPMASPAR